jgi:hypothetical protein
MGHGRQIGWRLRGTGFVENPGGEQYAMDPEEFDARYEATTEAGVFQAKGRIRAVENTTGGRVRINAPWGEPQFGGADCRFACAIKPDGSLDTDRPYIIGSAELNQTYTQEAASASEQALSTKFIDAGRAPAHLAANSAPSPGAEQTAESSQAVGSASARQRREDVTPQR